MTIFIDTAYIIATVNRRDKHHSLSKLLASRYRNRRFITSDVVLLEVGNALAKRYRHEAASIIEIFLKSDTIEIVHMTPGLFNAGLKRYKQFTDKEWGLVDCISFEIMETHKIREALTSDHHFVQAGYSALMAENY